MYQVSCVNRKFKSHWFGPQAARRAGSVWVAGRVKGENERKGRLESDVEGLKCPNTDRSHWRFPGRE